MKTNAGVIPLILTFTLVGCGSGSGGPEKHLVYGKVTLHGQPLETGEVIVRSLDGRTSSAGLIQDGSYSLEATSGQKRVEITAFQEIPGKFNEENPGEKVPVREQVIPEQFNEKSQLMISVGEETVEQDFDL